MPFCQTDEPTGIQPAVFLDPNKIGVYTNKIHYLCKNFLDQLPKRKFCVAFMGPVDPQKEPDYYTVIESPMDVGTIKERVQNFYYESVKELIEDFNLIISNCKLYYKSEDRVYRDCLKLEKSFRRVLSKMPIGEEKPSTKDLTQVYIDRLLHLERHISRTCKPSVSNRIGIKIRDLLNKLKAKHFKNVHEFDNAFASIFHGNDAETET